MRCAGLEREPHPDHFKGIREEDARDAGQTAREESPQRRLLLVGLDQHRPDLLVGDELDGGVREDAEQCGRVSAEETGDAFGPRDVPHGAGRTEPRSTVFGELGTRGLEQDLDSVKGRYEGFSLSGGVLVGARPC